jgi:hypothetical protein
MGATAFEEGHPRQIASKFLRQIICKVTRVGRNDLVTPRAPRCPEGHPWDRNGQARRPVLQGNYIYFHAEFVAGAAEKDAVDRTDIAVIAAPRYGDVAVGGDAIVGGVEIHPSEDGAPRGAPGVRGVGAD